MSFSEREAAEAAMTAVHNKLVVKGEKYKLAWGKVNDSKKIDDNVNEGKHKKEEIVYKTECPIYDSQNFTKPDETDKKSYTYNMNLNNYEEGYKPYYPSMDPKAMGGELKNKPKKKLKSEYRKIELEQDTSNTNSLLKLMNTYGDEDADK